MNVEKMNRLELLEELDSYSFLPGHYPNYEDKTNKELKRIVKIFRLMLKDYFKESEEI